MPYSFCETVILSNDASGIIAKEPLVRKSLVYVRSCSHTLPESRIKRMNMYAIANDFHPPKGGGNWWEQFGGGFSPAYSLSSIATGFNPWISNTFSNLCH